MTTRYININPEIMSGMPVITGTRVPMARVIFLLNEGYTTSLLSSELDIPEEKLTNAMNEFVMLMSTPEYAKELLKISASFR